jgi:hypothetical protein
MARRRSEKAPDERMAGTEDTAPSDEEIARARTRSSRDASGHEPDPPTLDPPPSLKAGAAATTRDKLRGRDPSGGLPRDRETEKRP